MDSSWSLPIGTDATGWLQNDQNIDDVFLDPEGSGDLFSVALGDLFASRGTPECAEEPLLNENLAGRLQADITPMHSSLDLSCTRDSEGDDYYSQALHTSSPFDFSSPELVYGNVLEVEPTNDADAGDQEPFTNFGWQKVRQDPGQDDWAQSPWTQDDVFGMETRGRPRRASIGMICRAGEISSMRRSRRSVQKSDSSWDEQDNLENFCDSVKTRLDEIDDPNSNIEKHFITDYLSRKKRRLVHALAHLGRFNHMTLDETKERRILVTTATIRCKADYSLGKCWNVRKSQWKLDPRTLIIMFPPNIERDQFGDTLTEMNLPIPRSYCQIAHSQHRRTYLAEFNTAGTAATFLDFLQARNTKERSESDTAIHIDVSYRYWSKDTPSDATFTDFSDVSEQQSSSDKILFLPDRHYRPTRASKYPPVSYRIDWTRSFNRRRMSRGTSSRGTDSSDGYGSSRSRSSSKRPFTAFDVDPSQRTHLYVDLSNDDLEIYDERPSRDASADSTAKRAKRLPKQAAGYICKEPGCGKVFDFSGECRKHERIHKPKEERPHACKYCEKRFIDKKDLMRHGKVHPAGRLLEVRREDNGWRTA